MTAAATDDVFYVFFVCTGNRARSVLAEALFTKYTHGMNVMVGSFGMLDLGPLPPLPTAVEAARHFQLDLRHHRSRPIRPGSLAAVDLVLGFEPQHVAAAVVEGGADIGRTFLLGELVGNLDAALDDPDPISRARSIVAAADSRRIRTRPDSSHSIPDPLGKPAPEMDRTAAEIDRLVKALVVGLFGA